MRVDHMLVWWNSSVSILSLTLPAQKYSQVSCMCLWVWHITLTYHTVYSTLLPAIVKTSVRADAAISLTLAISCAGMLNYCVVDG